MRNCTVVFGHLNASKSAVFTTIVFYPIYHTKNLHLHFVRDMSERNKSKL